MPFEPVFETITLCKRKGAATDRIKVECRTEAPAESVAKILNVSACVSVSGAAASAGKLGYGGTITFFVCYEDAEGAVRKCECGAEFTGNIESDKVTETTRARTCGKVVKTEASLAGVKLSVTATVEICAELFECASLSALKGGSDLITETREVSFAKSYGQRETVYPLEDEYELNYRADEVLEHRAEAAVTSVQCGVGSIIVDGEAYISAIFLQSGEKKDIIRENRTVPFRIEIECEDAMPAFSATARVQVRSLKTDVNVDEERGVSQVVCAVSLKASGEAFSEETAEITEDAFSLKEELDLSRVEEESVFECEIRSATVRAGGRASIEEIPARSYVLAACGENAEIVESGYSGGVIKVTGVLSMTGLYCDAEGKTFSRKAEVPFETSLEIQLEENEEYDISVSATRAVMRDVSLIEADIEAELVFTVYPRKRRKIMCINAAKATGEKAETDAAISVYIPTKGEELWSLAKRLNVAPDNLVATNKELEFPLSGEERIVVYRQK